MGEQLSFAEFLVRQAEDAFLAAVDRLQAESSEQGRYDYEEEDYLLDQREQNVRAACSSWGLS